MTKQQTYLTEVVGEDYKTWNKGDIILFSSPTGTGKTTFCTTLAAYAKESRSKILYVTSRLAKLDEFKNDTEGFDNFLYTTYQKLEQDISYNNTYLLNEYMRCKYIFIDECHYFTDDIAIPDSNASLSEEWLRKIAVSPIKIYASATADRYFSLLRKEINSNIRIYEVDKDYSYVTDCLVYRRNQVIDILRKILANELDAKILFFVNNTNRMEELFEEFGYDDADYLCSGSTTNTYLKKICNVTNETFADFSFEKRILFATKTIDIGVNIKDRNLRYIFCEMQDPNTIAQCLGRKRAIDQDDKCKFFICDQDAKTLSLHNNKVKKHIANYQEYLQNPEEFLQKHKNNRNLNKGGSVFILLPGSSEINIDTAKARKYLFDLRFYEYVKQYGFIEALKHFLDDELSAILRPYNDDAIDAVEFLKDKEGVRFYKDNKHIITDYFTTVIKGKRTFGLNVINKWLDDNVGEMYEKRFVSKKDQSRQTENGEKNSNYSANYWVLQ